MNAIPELHIRTIEAESDEPEQVYALYRKHSSTLGHLPRGAFDDWVVYGTVLAAFRHGRVVGYLGYRTPRGEIAIAHLCVARSERAQGVSNQLLHALYEIAGERTIRLNCAVDYRHARRLWERHGFICEAEKRGRGKSGRRLLRYVRRTRQPQPSLFSSPHHSESSDSTLAVIDANVFFDLSENTQESEESKALQSDWLEGQVVFGVTPELNNEISRHSCPKQRDRRRSQLDQFLTVFATADQMLATLNDLRPALPPAQCESAASDRKQLAYACAGGAAYFVTRDEELIGFADRVKSATGLIILRPLDLLRRLHSEGENTTYFPIRLRGTRITSAQVQSEAETAGFQSYGSGEKAKTWHKLIRAALSKPHSVSTRLYRDQNNTALCLVATRSSDAELQVLVLRTQSSPVSSTVLLRLLADLIEDARRNGITAVVLTDTREQTALHAAQLLGFQKDDSTWTRHLVSRLVRSTAELTPYFSPRADLSDRENAIQAERLLSPTKVLGHGIHTYVIPIRPPWAAKLFDSTLAEQELFRTDVKVALALQNAYFSASNISIPNGARIVWYVSGSKHHGRGTIRAASICGGTDAGTASAVFTRHQRFGVFRWNDVIAKVKEDPKHRLRAYRFSNTETFVNPVPLDDLNAIVLRHENRAVTFQSPTRIDETTFEEIYRYGMNLRE